MLAPLAILTLAAASAAGGGQPGAERLQVGDLERVEDRVDDQNVLSGPGRVMPAALAVPIGFEGVYRIPAGANTPYAGWFARVSGGVIAAFPASEYRFHKKIGVYPVVPAGTQYFMGGVPVRAEPNEQPDAHPAASRPLVAALSGAHSTRLNMSVQPARPGDRVTLPSQHTGTPTQDFTPAERAAQRTERLMLDDGYRAQRVARLMARAIEVRN